MVAGKPTVFINQYIQFLKSILALEVKFRQTPLSHSQQVVENKHTNSVGDDINAEETNISPSVAVTHSNCLQPLVSDSVQADTTVGCSVRVLHVSRVVFKVLGKVATTGLSLWRVQVVELLSRTVDFSIVQQNTNQVLHDIGEWRESPHKVPETRHQAWALHHTTERDHKTKGNIVNLEENRLGEPPQSGTRWLVVELNREVPADEVNGTKCDRVWNLNKHLGKQQTGPVESVGLGLSDLEELSRFDSSFLDLVCQWCTNHKGHETGKHDVLHTNVGVLDVPERETNQQTSQQHEHELGHHVVQVPIELEPGSSQNVSELHSVWDGVTRFSGLGVERTVLPDLEPILLDSSSSTSTNDLQNVLSRVLAVVTLSSSIRLKVVKHDTRTWSNVSEINGLTTSLQQKQSVKLFKQSGRRLMNGT
ncbi:hypothetical protein OGAPHI_005128 [Ogataea philodendri]|uniref:Uncharacterized protein n=1 Tax=Ogataea philodendri TaxID=1378263 RepID=A0A9P8T3E6_9ASCO|nr:uncharacterized protein OGAPHI_005128 [Ogataea philodendri]KAH3663726.1 hypothetical protein OGAPHI_005128 [Ogataea philodendri]